MNNEDMSDIFNKFKSAMNSSNDSISPDAISNLMKMFKNNSNNKSSNESSSNKSTPQFDMETIIKMKNIFDKLNKKDDPRSKLLLSLKPYLKESRKDKVEQYIQLFNMSKVLEMFNKASGGDNLK